MIKTKRFDYEERYNKMGKLIHPKFYECFYYWNGREIAFYDSRKGILYLNTKLLNKDFKLSYFERMNDTKFKEGFDELIDLLGINKDTKLSEFLNA